MADWYGSTDVMISRAGVGLSTRRLLTLSRAGIVLPDIDLTDQGITTTPGGCHWFLRPDAQWAENDSGKAAQRGTRLHELAETHTVRGAVAANQQLADLATTLSPSDHAL